MLDHDAQERQMTDKEINKRLLQYFKPHLGKFILSFIFMAITIIADLLPPLLLGLIIDTLSKKSDVMTDAAKMSYVLLIGGFIVVVIVSVISSYFQTMILQKIGQKDNC